MFKRIKQKIKRQKMIQVEILETLCSICLYLEYDQHFSAHGRYDNHFRSHFNYLKGFSQELRSELGKEVPDGGTRDIKQTY